MRTLLTFGVIGAVSGLVLGLFVMIVIRSSVPEALSRYPGLGSPFPLGGAIVGGALGAIGGILVRRKK